MSKLATTAEISGVRLQVNADNLAQPAAAHSVLFAKADGLYMRDENGVVTGPFGEGGTGGEGEGLKITFPGSPVEQGQSGNRNTSGTTLTRCTGEIYISQPLKLTYLDWVVRNNGTYKLGLTAGPTNVYHKVWDAGKVFAGAPGVLTFDFTQSPVYWLPGIYYLTLERLEGGTGWTDASVTSFSNTLFYTHRLWYDDQGYDTYTVPITIEAYLGEFGEY